MLPIPSIIPGLRLFLFPLTPLLHLTPLITKFSFQGSTIPLAHRILVLICPASIFLTASNLSTVVMLTLNLPVFIMAFLGAQHSVLLVFALASCLLACCCFDVLVSLSAFMQATHIYINCCTVSIITAHIITP